MSVVATLLVRVAANLTELDASFSELERGALRVQKAWAKTGAQLQGIGTKLSTGITLPLAGIAAAATSAFVDFDNAMSGVAAAIQPTTAELETLKAAALEWGAKTQFSATEAATALGELGKAGVKSADSVKLLPSVLNMATVGQMALADAASLTTDTLSQFGLESKDAVRVNDVLAQAAQSSTTSVKELGNALVYAGPLAGAFGMSIEETGAALAQFANLGFKADKAGIALKNVLGEVKNPGKNLRDVMGELGIKTLESADGTVHLTDVVRQLGKAGANEAQVLRAFGEVAGPVMVGVVRKGADSLEVLNESMRKSGGTAERVATTLMSGLGGAIEQMRGSLETAAVSIGSLLAPALTTVADLVGGVAEWVSGTLVPAFKELPGWVQAGAGAFLLLAAAIGPLIYIAGTLAMSWSALAGAFAVSAGGAATATGASATLTTTLSVQTVATWAATTATTALNAAIAVLVSPITWVVAGIAALVLGLRYLTGSWEGVLQVLTLGILNFDRLAAIWTGIKAVASGLVTAFGAIAGVVGEVVSAVAQRLAPLFTTLQGLWTQLTTTLGGAVSSAFESLKSTIVSFADSGVGRLVATLGELWVKVQLAGALAVFQGALKALEGVVWLAVKAIEGLVYIFKVGWAAVVDQVQIQLRGMTEALRIVASWFGVDLFGSIGRAIDQLTAFNNALKDSSTRVTVAVSVMSIMFPAMRGAIEDVGREMRRTAIEAEAVGRAAQTTSPFLDDLKNSALSIAEAKPAATFLEHLKTVTFALPGALAPVAPVVRKTAEELKAAADAAKRAREEFQKMSDAMSGKDAIDTAKRYTDVLADLTAKGMKPTAKAAADIVKALDDAADAIRSTARKVPDEMGRLWASLMPPMEVSDDLRNWTALFDRSMKSVIPSVRQMAGAVNTTLAGIKWEEFTIGLRSELRGAEMAALVDEWGRKFKGQVSDTLTSMFVGQTGFADGLRSMFGSVQSVANDLMSEFTRELQDQLTNAFSGGEFDFKELFGGKQGTAAGAAAGSAVGLTVGVAFGRQFGKTVGALAGAGAGAATAAMVSGGNWAAIGVGAGVGFVSGWFAGIAQEAQRKAGMQQARAELVATFGGMEGLGVAARQAGIDFDRLFDTEDPARFNALLQVMQVEIAKNKAHVEAMAKALDATTKAGELLSKVDLSNLALDTGRLPADGSPGAQRRIARGPLPGAEEAAFAFIGAQSDAALAGIDTFLSNAKIKTEAGAQAISASLAGIYQVMLEGGATPTQAFAAMEPTIAKLQAQLAATGMAADAAFTPLGALATLAADGIGGPVMDAMSGLAQGLTSTANLGLLNADSFKGFAGEIYNGFKQMEALGMGGEVALAGARSGIQKLWELSQDFGYKLNENEQGMVDFALASGTVGEQFRPAADRMANAIDKLVERMDKFLLKFSEVTPAAADASRGIEDTLGRTRVPPIDIRFRPKYDDDFPGAGAGGFTAAPSGSMVALGSGGVVRRPTVALIGESGPEAVVPLSSAFNASTDVTLMLDSEVLTRAVLRKTPRQMRAYGAAR